MPHEENLDEIEVYARNWDIDCLVGQLCTLGMFFQADRVSYDYLQSYKKLITKEIKNKICYLTGQPKKGKSKT